MVLSDSLANNHIDGAGFNDSDESALAVIIKSVAAARTEIIDIDIISFWSLSGTSFFFNRNYNRCYHHHNLSYLLIPVTVIIVVITIIITMFLLQKMFIFVFIFSLLFLVLL